jgi:methionyl aminopeptidase
MGWQDRGVELKTPDQVAAMRRVGLVVGRTLETLRAAVRPGVTTRELDAIADDAIRTAGAVPSFLGYQGFPACICASVNDEVVHGIPGDRELREGDLVSLDCGAIVAGWHGDAAITVPVGRVRDELLTLVADTEAAMWAGIAAARPGGRVGDISEAVEARLRRKVRYGILEDYTGHGIGTAMHQPPDVPNVRRSGRGARLVPGIALAVEPMVTLGSHETEVLDDDWTVVTADGSWAAHSEHTFALTERGAWVLTAIDGGEQALADLGAPFGGRSSD